VVDTAAEFVAFLSSEDGERLRIAAIDATTASSPCWKWPDVQHRLHKSGGLEDERRLLASSTCRGSNCPRAECAGNDALVDVAKMAGLPEALRQPSRAGFLHVIQVKEERMDHTHPGNIEPIEIVTTDFALAYSAIARRMAAIEAILKCNTWPGPLMDKLRLEVEGGMAVIKAVERTQLVVTSTREGD